LTTSYELARCIICESAETTELAGPEQVREEAEALWQFHMRRLSPHTPPERLVDRVAFSQPRAWRVVQCSTCGFVYRNPIEKPQAVRDSYEDESPTPEALHALHASQRRFYRAPARRLAEQLGPNASGLEIGSYVGAFLAASRDVGLRFEGLDLNPHVNGFTRSLGFTVHDGELDASRPGRTYDAVAIWNTFDQLADPKATARAAARVLRPEGMLAIRVPNGACYAEWRPRLSGRGRARLLARGVLAYNNLLTFPYRYGFTPDTLTRLLRDLGFRVGRVVPDVLVPTSDEWTRWWARVEARALKPLTKRWAPWFEVYATKESA
jgi:SAM-dependent methyltransferase